MDTTASAAPAPAQPPRWQQWLARVKAAVRGLPASLAAHSKERYREPWVALLGEAGAGKSSLVASLKWVREHPDAQATTRLGVPRTAWHQLPQGLLIDIDGAAPLAPVL